MKFFPESAPSQLEFDAIKQLLADRCQSAYAKLKALNLRVHTKREFIELQLQQTHEYTTLLQNNLSFPVADGSHLSRQLKLFSIPGAVLTGDDFLEIKKLSENIKQVFRWFMPSSAKPILRRKLRS